MAAHEPVPGFLIIDICIIIALVIFAAFRNLAAGWDFVLSAIVLFLLWVVATRRHWSIPHPLPFIHSTAVSDIVLGWLLTLVALSAAWFIGITLSRMYSDIMGILVALGIFGAIMLGISTVKEWQ
jgi:hypothetical protein